MKKIVFTLLLFTTAGFAFSQQKFHAFSINGKHGIANVSGMEVMKPTYKFSTVIPAKNQIYFQDFSDKPDIIFNAQTGARQLYESILNKQLQIKNVYYSIITAKGKKFLLSEETDKTIPLTRDYNDFEAVGQYIIADYEAQEPFVSGGTDKNGIPLPPKIRAIKKHYAVLTNDESLKTILDNGFDKYLPLYEIAGEKEDDRIVSIKTVKLEDFNRKPNFDYIVLSQGNNHKLYNAKMILVKAFVLANANEEKLQEYAEKLIKVKFGTQTSSERSSVGAPPMVAAPSMGRNKNSDAEPNEKKQFKQYFYIKKLENGNTIFALQETGEISKRIFEAKPSLVVKLFDSDHRIIVSTNGKEVARFSYDSKTGTIFLPKAYYANLGLTVL